MTEWTPEMQARLAELWTQGIAGGAIAQRLSLQFKASITSDQVWAQRERQNLPKRERFGRKRSQGIWSEAEGALDRLAELWVSGLSAGQIAAALSAEFRVKFSRSAVIGKVHRLGLAGRPSPILHHDGNKRKSRAALQESRREFNGKPLQGKRTFMQIMPMFAGPVAPASKCQYIAGEPSADDSCKCLRATVEGSSYCAEHHARVWVKPGELKKVAA